MDFNIEAFLDNPVETLDTKREIVPEGEYTALVDDLTVKSEQGFLILDVIWDVLDDDLRTRLNLKKVTVRQSYFVDVDINGCLASGKNSNIGIGQLREALGLNSPGIPLRALKGAGPARIAVRHRVDKNDATKVYAEVRKVARL